MTDDPICPKCGGKAKRADTQYGTRHSCCDLWSWRGKPLCDAKTHAARRSAHSIFDELWEPSIFSRIQASRKLREKLGLTEKECHMASMEYNNHVKIPVVVREIWQENSPFGALLK